MSNKSAAAPASLSKRCLFAALLVFGVFLAGPVLARQLATSELVVDDDVYSVRRWTTDNGLPSNFVHDLAQTPDGYIWVATDRGLLRFDGIRFVQIDLTSDRGLEQTYVRNLVVDAAGTLWAVMLNHGRDGGELAQRVGETWASVRHYEGPGAAPTVAVSAPDGAIWLGFGEASQGGVERWRGDEITHYDIPDLTFYSDAIVVDRSGIAWVGTVAPEVVRIDGDRVTRIQVEGDSSRVHSLSEDGEGRIWLGTLTDLYRWDGDSFELYPGAGGSTIWRISGAGAGHLWVNRTPTLQRIAWGMPAEDAPATTTAPPYEAGLVTSSLEDAEGNHWFGFLRNGLVQLRRHALPAPSRDDDELMNVNLLLSLAPGTAGTMWVAEDCRARLLRPDGTRLTLTDGFPKLELSPARDSLGRRSSVGWFHPDCVNGLAVAGDGALWYTHGQNLLTRVEDGVATRFSYPKSSSDYDPESDDFPQGRPSRLIAGPDGDLWYVRQGEGIVKLLPSGEQIVYSFPGAPGFPDVTRLRPGRAGEVWYATDESFGRVRWVGGDQWTADEWPSTAAVSDFHVAPDGRVLVASLGGGLLAIDDDSATRVTQADGLHDNTIARIIETDAGDLWLASGRGVMVVANRHLNDYLEGEIDRLDVGLLGRDAGAPEFIQPARAAEKGPDGRIWLFGSAGIVIADPARIRVPTAPPTVIIEEVTADGERLSGTSEFVVGPGTARIEIAFTAPTFDAPERVRFRYRLEGQDEEWLDAADRRWTAYSTLWPGEYTFRVMARGNFGPWTEEPASVRIRVLPAWWQTTWFIVVALLGIFSLGAAAQTLRTRAVRRRNLELEREVEAREFAEVELRGLSRRMITAQEEDRARIGRDLHDDVSQRLYATRMGLDSARRALASDAERGAQEFEALRDELKAVAADTRKISHRLHPATLELLGLPDALEALVEDFGTATGAQTRAAIPESMTESMSAETSLALYRITQEALRNIRQHADASRVEVDLTVCGDRVRLSIHDDGRGFESGKSAGGLGLASMRERARLLGGTLTIDTHPGSGTELQVELPLTDLP